MKKVKKNSRNPLSFPSNLFHRDLLYVGINVRLDDLAKTAPAGYFKAPPPKRKGEYHIVRQSAVEIFLHDFDFPTEQRQGAPVRVSLQGSMIARIENLATGKDLFDLELEPELVTGLYERIWQERKLVKLPEVPPLLVKAILAVEDERFYSHNGIDPIGIVGPRTRAALNG